MTSLTRGTAGPNPLCFRFGLLPVALRRFHNHAPLDGVCRHADVADFAVDERLDPLKVRHKTALGDRCHVRADAALLLRFATAPNMIALDGPGAGQFTNS